ncbi:hypothetical protein PR048_014146 [Dryococelus australis]|uniref:Uncharacterized protein n=1 Tax=Dryococelus australis TaxID=614101 RepID=A0ABQ9HDH9_9NEOP|nr:hypothetical protein PR048_014146 [Dryococelus australis]
MNSHCCRRNLRGTAQRRKPCKPISRRGDGTLGARVSVALIASGASNELIKPQIVEKVYHANKATIGPASQVREPHFGRTRPCRMQVWEFTMKDGKEDVEGERSQHPSLGVGTTAKNGKEVDGRREDAPHTRNKVEGGGEEGEENRRSDKDSSTPTQGQEPGLNPSRAATNTAQLLPKAKSQGSTRLGRRRIQLNSYPRPRARAQPPGLNPSRAATNTAQLLPKAKSQGSTRLGRRRIRYMFPARMFECALRNSQSSWSRQVGSPASWSAQSPSEMHRRATRRGNKKKANTHTHNTLGDQALRVKAREGNVVDLREHHAPIPPSRPIRTSRAATARATSGALGPAATVPELGGATGSLSRVPSHSATLEWPRVAGDLARAREFGFNFVDDDLVKCESDDAGGGTASFGRYGGVFMVNEAEGRAECSVVLDPLPVGLLRSLSEHGGRVCLPPRRAASGDDSEVCGLLSDLVSAVEGGESSPQPSRDLERRRSRHRKSDNPRKAVRRRRDRSGGGGCKKRRKRSTSSCSTASSGRHRHRHRSPAPEERPPVPSVNPIFVWVKQEGTRIVEVLCEDYDKRNRIKIRKTATGWRAIPRTERPLCGVVSSPIDHREKPPPSRPPDGSTDCAAALRSGVSEEEGDRAFDSMEEGEEEDEEEERDHHHLAMQQKTSGEGYDPGKFEFYEDECDSPNLDACESGCGCSKTDCCGDECSSPKNDTCENECGMSSADACESVHDSNETDNCDDECDSARIEECDNRHAFSEQRFHEKEFGVAKIKNCSDMNVCDKDSSSPRSASVGDSCESNVKFPVDVNCENESDKQKVQTFENKCDSSETGEFVNPVSEVVPEVQAEPTDLSLPKKCKYEDDPIPRRRILSRTPPTYPQRKSVFLESLLSTPRRCHQTPVKCVDSIPELRPLDLGSQLGQSSGSPSPTVSCSEDKKPLARFVTEVPEQPKVNCMRKEDITLKNLLSRKPKLTSRPACQASPKCDQVFVVKKSDEQGAETKSSKSRLLELLTSEPASSTSLSPTVTDPDPLTQLKTVLSDPSIVVPDPLLVPRNRLQELVSSPAKEIPRLLAMRPELRLPDVLSHPALLQDPDLLVVSLAHLQNLLQNSSNINREEAAAYSTLGAFLEWQWYQNQQVAMATELLDSQLKQHEQCGGISQGEFDAAAAAAFNQMLWLPYVNQLEAAFSCGKNPELLNVLSTVMPSGYPSPQAGRGQSIQTPVLPSATFAAPSSADYKSQLEQQMLALWHKAAVQSGSATTAVPNNRHSKGNLGLAAHGKNHVNNRHSSIDKRASSARTSPISPNYHQQQQHQRQQQNLAAINGHFYPNNGYVQTVPHYDYNHQRSRQPRARQSRPEMQYKQMKTELPSPTEVERHGKSSVTCKSLLNLLADPRRHQYKQEACGETATDRKTPTTSPSPHLQKLAAGDPQLPHLLPIQDGTTNPPAHPAQFVSKLKVKNLVDPNITPKLLKEELMPGLLSPTTGVKTDVLTSPLQSAPLWHPLFGR